MKIQVTITTEIKIDFEDLDAYEAADLAEAVEHQAEWLADGSGSIADLLSGGEKQPVIVQLAGISDNGICVGSAVVKC